MRIRMTLLLIMSKKTRGGGNGGGTTPACSNNADDDNDGFTDASDPQCHTDGDPTNDDSYDPTINDEEGDLPACWNGTDDDGDGAVDLDDPNCDSATDTDESDGTNGGSGSGGGGGSGGTIVGIIDLGEGATVPADISCDAYLTEFIREGQENNPDQVRRLQYVLKNFEGHNIEVNGVYDKATLAAVHSFQTKYADDILTPWGISNSTGYVYLTTRKKINEIFCSNTKAFPLTSGEQQIIVDTRARVLQFLAEQAQAQEIDITTPIPEEILDGIGQAEPVKEDDGEEATDTESQLAGAGAAANGTSLSGFSAKLREFMESLSQMMRWSPEAEGVE